MGKNIKIVAVAALLIFVTLTQAATTEERIQICENHISRSLRELLRDIIPVVELCMKEMSRSGVSYRTMTYRDIFKREDIQTRLQSLLKLSPKSGYEYTQLHGLSNTDDRCLPVCLAYEYLIIARALRDLKRFHYYTTYRIPLQLEYPADAETRLSEYLKFVSEHVDKKLALRLKEVVLAPYLEELAARVDRLLVQENLSAGTGRTPQSTNSVDRPELNLIERVGRGETSEPMVASTYHVYTPTQELLGQHRKDDRGAPHPVLYDFFPASKQGSGITHGTHCTEGHQAPSSFEQQFVVPQPSIPHHAAESSTHGHDNRNRGKMTMYDDSYQDHYYYGPGDGYRRR
ncbi:hypothetical protein SeMB42_g07390 [Synchytrium endobioticum]|nr:hypothetical protein SeMB42_g07390 [Synchytrium endobioticum]